MFTILMGGFILFTYIIPMVIVFQYNVVLEEGGYDLNIFGFLLALVIIFVSYKALSKRINIWDIQNRNRTFRIIFSTIKTLFIIGVIWWGYETISSAYEKIHMTLMLVFFSVLIGSILRMLSLVVKHNKTIKGT